MFINGTDIVVMFKIPFMRRTQMFRWLSRTVEEMFSAITFAEAGEYETAREFLLRKVRNEYSRVVIRA